MKKIVSLICAITLVTSMTGCSSKKEVFEGTAKGYGGDVVVKVTFEGDKIVKVEAVGESETAGVGSNAIEQLPQKIVEANGVEVDSISGATVTSNAIIEATKKAIKLKNNDNNTTVAFKPGTYTGTSKGYKGDITVEVEVDETNIKSVTIVEQGDTYGIGYGMDETPVEVLPVKIVETQGLGVDTVTGATTTSNGILTAVAAAVEQSGVDVSLLKDIKDNKTAEDIVIDVDVVVVGAGSTGLSAAITAANNGASVLLVEKQGIVGGAATRSGGKLMAAGTEIQKADNVEDNAAKMCKYLIEVAGEYADEEKLNAFCDNSLEVYDWMEELGVDVQDVEPIHSSLDTKRVHNTRGGGGMTSGFGGQITVPLYDAYKGLEQQLLFDTTINEIIVNEKGEVSGVKGTKKDGSAVTVNAKSVIVATGGYAANKDMVKSYGETFEMYVTSVPAGNVGEGITMSEAVGAQIYDNPAVQVVFLDFGSGVGINEEAGLILTQNGRRVVNEYTYQYNVGDTLAKEKSHYGWYIATANDTTPTVQYAMTLDSTLKANSVEELAKLMEVDEKTLVDTINHYNEMAKSGKDTDFGKPTEFMYPIEGETYFAMKLLPSVTVTFGGIVTDTNAQVLNGDNQPIKNLYAAGEVAFPGIFGTEYPGCGLAISSGAYYGRVAGELAAQNSK